MLGLLLGGRYGLVTEQKKGSYKYFVDLGDRMEVARVRTVYIDEVRFAFVFVFWLGWADFGGWGRHDKRKWKNRKWCMGWALDPGLGLGLGRGVRRRRRGKRRRGVVELSRRVKK